MLVESTHVELQEHLGRLQVILDGVDVTEEIRTPDVTRAVSSVSSLHKVREAMVRQQRLVDREGGVVLEGRDIGTVVFPDADLKFFMVADIEERARRRADELRAQGIEARPEDLVQDIRRRDSVDSTRSESPLRRAPDAIEIDTSRLTIDQQVDFVIRRVQEVEERNTRR
jgi:CMP/dCMP kinase